MPRRTGKAATRRARQQRRTKQGPSPAVAAPRPPVVESPEADEPGKPAPRPTAPVWTAATTSRLGESARAEYHYVARDLRNSAVLVLVMAVLLAVAVVAVNIAGIAPQ
jgi:hypothetical protein